MDGKLRREHLYVKFGDDFYPSFALVAAALAMGKDISDITIQGDAGVAVGDTFIPTDPAGRMRVNYLGGEETFAKVSASDILDGNVSPAALAGKIVFMGTSAISTYDFMVTPFSARTPAVEKNATVTENIVHSRFIHAAPLTIASVLVAASGLLLSFVLPRIRAALGISLAFFMLALFGAANFLLFAKRGIYLNFIYPFINMAVISVVFGSYKYFAEERRSKELKRMFSSYVSPKIVAELMSNPEMAKLGGYRREVSILFSDLRGFTTFSENRDPEEVVSMLNEYFKEMTDIIFRWDGTLDKFVGDEIMAFWGAPAIQPNHAELAVRCALEMSDRLDRLQNRWRDEGKYVLDCGIGINTGTVLIGNIGAVDKKMDYTAIGDNVNLGARVEALTRKYEARILITEFTQSKIADLIENRQIGHVEMIEADLVKVKGKEIPVRIYRMTPLAHAH
jgi:adenylate cyclase